jgi:hypothetical protein
LLLSRSPISPISPIGPISPISPIAAIAESINQIARDSQQVANKIAAKFQKLCQLLAQFNFIGYLCNAFMGAPLGKQPIEVGRSPAKSHFWRGG